MLRRIDSPRRVALRVAVLAIFFAVPSPARADADLYDKVLRSTGWVIVPKDEKDNAMGTCWLLDKEQKLAVTCQHVVGDATEVLVYFPRTGKDEVIAEASYYLRKTPAIYGQVIAADAARDLALLRLRSVPEDAVPLPLAPRSSRPGEVIHSVGNAGLSGGFSDGTLWWYTWGTVRQIHRLRVEAPDGARSVRMVQTQAPVNQGDSGGPVVNDQGQLVGVTRAYEADVRLVTENVDVHEVKDFLSTAVTAAKARGDEAATQPLLGPWQFAIELSSGKSVSGRAEFKPDGTFVMRPSRKGESARQGRYTYANGVLWLITDRGIAATSVSWTGGDRFSCHGGRPKLQFDRVAAQAEEHTYPVSSR